MNVVAYETRHARDALLPTHRHHRAYAALVIDGSYTECSLDGPLVCSRGTIVVHPAFHAHGDRFGGQGARVVNLELPPALAVSEATAWRAHDLDEARDVFERCPQWFPQLLACARPEPASELPAWQRTLFAALREGDEEVSALAKQVGVSAEHASRAFRRSHGMSPRVLRREARWRVAVKLLRGDRSLAEIAASAGFADQSHLSRVVRAHAGCTPAVLRRQIKSVQDTRIAGIVE
jgi:AraC family transcriptional regulator